MIPNKLQITETDFQFQEVDDNDQIIGIVQIKKEHINSIYMPVPEIAREKIKRIATPKGQPEIVNKVLENNYKGKPIFRAEYRPGHYHRVFTINYDQLPGPMPWDYGDQALANFDSIISDYINNINDNEKLINSDPEHDLSYVLKPQG